MIESSISINKIAKAVDLSRSSVDLALPEGRWDLEISLNENEGPWLRSETCLQVTSSSEPVILYFKV